LALSLVPSGSNLRAQVQETELGLYIVRLASPPAVELRTQATGSVSLQRSADRRVVLHQAARSVLAYQQDWMARRLRDTELVVVGTAAYVGNHVFIRGKAKDVAALEEDPQVEGVYPALLRHRVLDFAPSQMNVTDLWEALGEGHAGAGVSIAIVDSGICIDHPMFRADGMTAPRGFPLGSRQFTNSKVIVARSYHQLFPVPPLLPGQQTPDDEDGHGTAVAAVAAGRETLSPQFGWIRGIAPRAWLGNYKIFGTGAQNGGLGVDVQGAFEGRIENSIFADNTGIDLSATGPVPVFGSLIGRAGRTTTLAAGNLVGRDPRFLNSAGGNYRPLFNSPAIDAGVFPTVTVKPWDFSGRLRIVDGDGDGDPRPDAGAFEFASEYAGRWILPLGADEFTGVAVVNAASSRFSGETVLRVHFREGKNSDRPVPRTADFFIGREKQNAATLSELFPSSPPRWVEVSPEHPFMAGFTLTGDMALKRLDGFVLSPPTESPLTLLGLSDPNPLRRIHLVNPGVEEVKVLASWMADTGTIHREVTMPPRQAVTLDLDELVPERRDPGFLRLSTLPPTQPIHASVTSGDEQKRAVLPALSASDAAAELFGAQFAATDSIRTHIELVSLEGAVPVRISVFDEDGRLLGETTRTVRDSAPTEGDPGEWLGLNNVVGWIRVSSTALEAKLVGALTFRDPDGRLAATLPLQPMASAARVSVFSHVAEGDGNFTGITLLNPDPNATALLALEVYAPEGTLEGRYLGELCGRCKKACVLPEWVPAVAHRWGGWIRLRSNRPLLGFELFGNGDYLAAVPQQAIIR